MTGRGLLTFSDEVIDADRSANMESPVKTPSAQLARTAFAISLLRERLHRVESSHPNPRIILGILQEAKELDLELITWRDSIPKDWETCSSDLTPDQQKLPEVGIPSEEASAWQGYITSFPDLATARKLNAFRMHRIAVQTLIACCANWLARNQPPNHNVAENTINARGLLNEARRAVRSSVDGICASVPYHLQCLAAADARNKPAATTIPDQPLQPPSPTKAQILCRRPPLPNTFMNPGLPPSNLLPPRKLGGLMILQPLAFACAVSAVPAAQRRWMLDRALDIARCADMDERLLELRLGNTMSE